MAAASVYVMNLDKLNYDAHTQPMQSHINVGYGKDVTIAELADAVAQAVGYQGEILFDPTKPDGTPRKWMASKSHCSTRTKKFRCAEDCLLAFACTQGMTLIMLS